VQTRLFHFSDRGDIERFVPRTVEIPSPRPPGKDWLNGPLVWAIDDWHQPMYLFPRDCPRVLLWPTRNTAGEDRRRWWGERRCRMMASIEWRWLKRLCEARLFRYEMPVEPFECLKDAGMWVARSPVTPTGVEEIRDLPGALERCEVELQVMTSLAPLRVLWSSSLHVSGLRLRNAAGWTQHSP
jgi:hypothetical protein